MGFLDGLFGSRVSNPALVSAMEKYLADGSDDNLVDVWQKFLKSKILLATNPEAAKAFARVKNIKDAIGLPFNTASCESGDNLLAVFTDNAAFESSLPATTTAIAITGEQAFQLASCKGLLGMALNPSTQPSISLKVWQHQIFIERLADANKLHALATKLSRSGNHADAEGVLKGAIAAAQKDPGPQHPFTAELNIELARAMRAQGKLTEAEWIYRRALSIYEASGSQDLEVASTAEQLGTLLCENKKSAAATPFLERALQIYERVPNAKPDGMARILCQLAEAQIEESHMEEGEAFYKRATIMLEERKHPDLVGVLNKMAALQVRQGKEKEALINYTRAIAIFDTLKRCREYDMATAAHRAAELHIAEGQFSEAEPLLERALPVYRREGTKEDIDAVEQLKSDIATRRAEAAKAREEEEREQEKHKPAFARGGKRPAELPLLDMSAVKSNPKANYVGNARNERSEEKSEDPEAEALEQMRAFLDSVGDVATTDTKLSSPKEAAPDQQPTQAPPAMAQPEQDDSMVESLVRAALHEAQSPNKVADEVSSQPFEPAPPAVHDDPKDATPEREEAQNAEPTDAGEHDHVGVDDLFSSVTSSDRIPIAQPKSQTESKSTLSEQGQAKIEEKQPTGDAKGKGLFGQNIEAEISGIFGKSVIGNIAADDRYDKPIAERLKQESEAKPRNDFMSAPPSPPSPPARPTSAAGVSENVGASAASDSSEGVAERTAPSTPEIAPAAAKSADSESAGNKLFGDGVDAEISAVFNRSMMGNISRSDRFDMPINARSSQENPTLQAANATKQESKEDPGLFGSELDSSLDSAFSSILADPQATAADRFDTPIQERKQVDADRFDTPIQERKQVDADRFDIPIQERKQVDADRFDIPIQERKQVDADRFDTPIQERKQVDADRFDTPIQERKQVDADRFDTPIQERKQVDADRFDTPIQERKQVDAEPMPAAAAEPEKPALPDLSTAKTADELLDLIDRHLEAEPRNIELWLRKGTVLVQQQRIDEAIKIFDKVTTMCPDDLKTWYCKGASLHLKNRFEDALYCFNYVLKLEPDNLKALLRKAECMVKLGRADQSMAIYDRMLTLNPKFVTGWLSKARTQLQQRKLEDAFRTYEHILTLDPANEEATKAKALIATKLGAAAR